MRGREALILLAIVTLPIPASARAQGGVLTARVELYRDGWAEVVISVNLTGDEAYVVMPIAGDPSYLLVTDESDLPLNYTLSDGEIAVESLGARRVSISYQTANLTSKDGPLWNASLSLPGLGRSVVILPEGAEVVGLSSPPDVISTSGGVITLEFSGEDWWVAYLLAPGGGRPPETPGEGTAGDLGGGNPGEGGAAGSPLTSAPWVYAIVAGLAAASVAILLRRGRGGARPPEDGVSRAILRALEEAGGSARQADLVRELGLPRTTVWRRLRRLEEAGLVELRREEGGTVAVLRGGGTDPPRPT